MELTVSQMYHKSFIYSSFEFFIFSRQHFVMLLTRTIQQLIQQFKQVKNGEGDWKRSKKINDQCGYPVAKFLIFRVLIFVAVGFLVSGGDWTLVLVTLKSAWRIITRRRAGSEFPVTSAARHSTLPIISL